MASEIRAFWEEVITRFDPERPVEHPQWRASRPYSPRETIAAGLRRPSGARKQYAVLGTVGTGKTTELLAIAEEQTRERMVVFLDVWRHFEERVGAPAALNYVQPWELLFLIGLAIYRSAQEILGHEWSREHIEEFEHAVQAFVDTDPATVGHADTKGKGFDLAKLVSNIAAFAGSAMDGGTGLALRFMSAASSAGHWNFRLGEPGRARLSDQDTRVRALQSAINLLIATLQRRYQKLLVVIDGLDRVKNVDTTRGLFVESTVLGSLECATVLTCPLTLHRRRLAAQMRHFEPLVLANLPVLDQRDPRQPGPGIDFFVDVYHLRVQNLAGAELGIPDSHLRTLAYFSGGQAREFVRMVQICAELAWDRELALVDETITEECKDKRRRVMEGGLNRGLVNVLQDVMNDPDHMLPDDDHVEDLLDQLCLLPFPNESEWYYPHPLLTMRLVRPG